MLSFIISTQILIELEMAYYKDVREYLSYLEKEGKLTIVDIPVDKNTELTPLVRLQYRGLAEEERRGFLFTKVLNGTSEMREISKVATGIYASSTHIYAMGLKAEPTNEAIRRKWEEALLHPVKTRTVSEAPVQEVVITREEMEKGRGLNILPVPAEVPGFSGQLRTTTHIITKDPKSGWVNMGNYSMHLIGKSRALWEINRGNHGWVHLLNARDSGMDYLEFAVVIGGPPVLFYVASAKVPYGVNELEVAGGLAGEPLEVVKAKTVDLEVPAHAEIIVEGKVSTKDFMVGNAFGEYTGYMATDVFLRPVMDITAITMRRDPIFVHIMSQMPPSESSKVRQISSENIYYKFLKDDCKVPGIIDVAWHELSQAQLCVIRMKKINNSHPWQVLHLAAGYEPRWGKIFVTVDEDIDARDLDTVMWAMGWRMQPDRDVEIIKGRFAGLDVSAYKPDAPHSEKESPNILGSSAMLIDATRKWPYPPVSLPKKQYMERALELWKKLGLPALKLREPWYGYELGYWPKEYKEDAEYVVRGDFESIGRRLEERTKRENERRREQSE